MFAQCQRLIRLHRAAGSARGRPACRWACGHVPQSHRSPPSQPKRQLRQQRGSFIGFQVRWAHSHHDDDSTVGFGDLAAGVKHELEVVHRVVATAHAHERLAELREAAAAPDLWSQPTHAAAVLQELDGLETRATRVGELRRRFLDTKELFALASDEAEEGLMDECLGAMRGLRDETRQLRLELLLATPSDASACFVEIQAGAGGTESCDWVAMLARMYTRWAQGRGFAVQYVDESPGDEAGFRSVMLRIDGGFAYGWAKTEAGVHRLVRISPFDSAGRRHTSFAQVRVYPMAAMGAGAHEQGKHAAIPTKDLRIDTYRSSGAGGQHVNTTDSAVRITHVPTGIVVTCQSDRSQHRNKAAAMEVLRAKLYQRELEEQARQRHAYTQGLGENAWGNQIRSYVLQPYKLIKDHRTNYSETDPERVLDGDLDTFMEQMLLAQAASADSDSSSDNTSRS